MKAAVQRGLYKPMANGKRVSHEPGCLPKLKDRMRLAPDRPSADKQREPIELSGQLKAKAAKELWPYTPEVDIRRESQRPRF